MNNIINMKINNKTLYLLYLVYIKYTEKKLYEIYT